MTTSEKRRIWLAYLINSHGQRIHAARHQIDNAVVHAVTLLDAGKTCAYTLTSAKNHMGEIHAH